MEILKDDPALAFEVIHKTAAALKRTIFKIFMTVPPDTFYN